MLTLCDLRFPSCLMSAHTGFSLRFVAFLRRPALRAFCAAQPRLPADWAARLYPADCWGWCGWAVRRLWPAVMLPAWGICDGHRGGWRARLLRSVQNAMGHGP